jgi:hypothetical protein
MYLGGSVANNSFNPGQWDFSSANTYIGMGVGGLLGGFGGAGVGALLKAKKGSQLLSSAYSGGLNMFYNYSPDQNVGTMLGYFAAGFGAGMIGASAVAKGAVLANAKASAMFAGGLFNSGVALMAGELTDAYTLAQAFVGGALVGYAGTSYFAKKAGMKGKYLLKSKADKVFERGITNIASNFAFTDKSEYMKMSGHGRFGAPFAYGVVGYLAEGLMPFDAIKDFDNTAIRGILGTGAFSLAFGTEYVGMTFSKGYYDEFKDAKGGKWKKKTAIIGWKSVFYGLTLY